MGVSKQVSPDSVDLKVSFANCIFQWSYVEATLSFVYQSFLGGDKEEVFRIWHSTRSFNSKILKLEEASKIYLKDEYALKLFGKLIKENRKLKKIRDKLAHAGMFFDLKDKRDEMVVVPYMSLAKLSPDQHEQFEVSDLKEFDRLFYDLCRANMWFKENICDGLNTQEASLIVLLKKALGEG